MPAIPVADLPAPPCHPARNPLPVVRQRPLLELAPLAPAVPLIRRSIRARAANRRSIRLPRVRGGGDRQFADASIARNPALLEIVTGKSPAGSVRGGADPRVSAPSCAVEKSLESAPSLRKRGRNPWRIKRLQRREIASGGAGGMLAVTITANCIERCADGCGSSAMYAQQHGEPLASSHFSRNPEPGRSKPRGCRRGKRPSRAGSSGAWRKHGG